MIAGGALILVGLVYLVRQLRGGHGHVHLFGSHSHDPTQSHDHHSAVHDHDHHHEPENAADEIERIEEQWSHRRSDWTVIVGLFALLTFSPCEAFLPVFLIGAKYGWLGFVLLSAILAIATVAGMITFTWLTMLGLQRLRIERFEKFEPLIISAVFCLLGVLVIIFER